MTESELPAMEQLGTFLADRHGQPVEVLAPLDGGFWSTAYGYEVGEHHFLHRSKAWDRIAHLGTIDARPDGVRRTVFLPAGLAGAEVLIADALLSGSTGSICRVAFLDTCQPRLSPVTTW